MPQTSKSYAFEAALGNPSDTGRLTSSPLSPIFLNSLSSFEAIEVPVLGEFLLMANARFVRSLQSSLVGLAPNRLLLGQIMRKEETSDDFIYNRYFIVSAVEEQDLSALREDVFAQAAQDDGPGVGSLDSQDEITAYVELKDAGGDTERLASNADRNIINSSATAGENPFESRSPTRLNALIAEKCYSLSALLAGDLQPQENLQRFKSGPYLDKPLFKKVLVNKTNNLELKLKGLNREISNA